MNEKLSGAIEVLLEELNQQMAQIAETKKMINSLRQRMGEDPMFADVTAEQAAGGAVRPDQYYGKALATAAQEYLERRKQACSADDILKGLEQGGFDFEALGWKENRMRSLAMSLAKNTRAFHRLPNGSFGLISWYDEKLIRRRDPEKAEAEPSQDSTKEAKKASA